MFSQTEGYIFVAVFLSHHDESKVLSKLLEKKLKQWTLIFFTDCDNQVCQAPLRGTKTLTKENNCKLVLFI